MANQTLVERVTDAVGERGAASLEDIQHLFPDATRKQVHSALANARDRGLIRVKAQGRGMGRGQGRLPATWERVPDDQIGMKRRGTFCQPIKPPASVFELAADRPRTKWPPRFEGGRSYAPLGGWTE